MRNAFDQMKEHFSKHLAIKRQYGQISKRTNVGQLIGGLGISESGGIGLTGNFSGASFSSDDPEIAFIIAVIQLQYKASYLGANALTGFRWDIDFDSQGGVINFFGTAYATAIKIRQNEA